MGRRMVLVGLAARCLQPEQRGRAARPAGPARAEPEVNDNVLPYAPARDHPAKFTKESGNDDTRDFRVTSLKGRPGPTAAADRPVPIVDSSKVVPPRLVVTVLQVHLTESRLVLKLQALQLLSAVSHCPLSELLDALNSGSGRPSPRSVSCARRSRRRPLLVRQPSRAVWINSPTVARTWAAGSRTTPDRRRSSWYSAGRRAERCKCACGASVGHQRGRPAPHNAVRTSNLFHQTSACRTIADTL
jgi:hypothetical protein